MEMQLASLNEKGVKRFADYIRVRETGKEPEPPFGLLEVEEYVQLVEHHAVIEKRTFETSLEMAEYLCGILNEARNELWNDNGMWAWLTLFFVEQLLPAGEKPNKMYKYIPEGDNYHTTRQKILRDWRASGYIAKTRLSFRSDSA